MNQDTIAAIATPPFASAIGIIRISGDETEHIIETLFNCKIAEITPRYMVTKHIIEPETNTIIDECCFTFYKGPKSYTGEDMLEIFCHGSTYISQKILTIITSFKNCRLAKNGEFTQQSFINGKIDLAKAESILDIIESNSKKSHEIALSQYQGAVYKNIKTTRTELMTILQKVEASLEFPDDVGAIANAPIEESLQSLLINLNQIKENSDYGQKIKEGIRYLIIGKPNVGKSSLINCISGENRSIVSDIAGTTRDYIDLSIEYKGILVTIIDTAGIRSTDNEIENLGIEKIKELSNTVDGYIHVHDITTKYDPSIPDIMNQDKPIIHVFNKIDTQPNVKKNNNALYISCKNNTGIKHLKETLINQFIDTNAFESDLILCNVRQISSLNEATKCIQNATEHLSNKQTLDIISIEIRDAIYQLNNILGEDFTEELLDGIFEKFCIGK